MRSHVIRKDRIMEKKNPLNVAKTFVVENKTKLVIGAIVGITIVAAIERGRANTAYSFLEEKELLQEFEEWLITE